MSNSEYLRVPKPSTVILCNPGSQRIAVVVQRINNHGKARSILHSPIEIPGVGVTSAYDHLLNTVRQSSGQ